MQLSETLLQWPAWRQKGWSVSGHIPNTDEGHGGTFNWGCCNQNAAVTTGVTRAPWNRVTLCASQISLFL